jgi:hypothetical protein
LSSAVAAPTTSNRQAAEATIRLSMGVDLVSKNAAFIVQSAGEWAMLHAVSARWTAAGDREYALVG